MCEMQTNRFDNLQVENTSMTMFFFSLLLQVKQQHAKIRELQVCAHLPLHSAATSFLHTSSNKWNNNGGENETLYWIYILAVTKIRFFQIMRR